MIQYYLYSIKCTVQIVYVLLLIITIHILLQRILDKYIIWYYYNNMANKHYDELLEQIDSFILNTLAHASLTPYEISASLDGFLERYHISLASVTHRLNELQLDCMIGCICQEADPNRSFFALRIPVDDVPMFSLDDTLIDSLCDDLNLLPVAESKEKIFLTVDDAKPVLHIDEEELVILDVDVSDEEIIGELNNVESIGNKEEDYSPLPSDEPDQEEVEEIEEYAKPIAIPEQEQLDSQDEGEANEIDNDANFDGNNEEDTNHVVSQSFKAESSAENDEEFFDASENDEVPHGDADVDNNTIDSAEDINDEQGEEEESPLADVITHIVEVQDEVLAEDEIVVSYEDDDDEEDEDLPFERDSDEEYDAPADESIDDTDEDEASVDIEGEDEDAQVDNSEEDRTQDVDDSTFSIEANAGKQICEDTLVDNANEDESCEDCNDETIDEVAVETNTDNALDNKADDRVRNEDEFANREELPCSTEINDVEEAEKLAEDEQEIADDGDTTDESFDAVDDTIGDYYFEGSQVGDDTQDIEQSTGVVEIAPDNDSFERDESAEEISEEVAENMDDQTIETDSESDENSDKENDQQNCEQQIEDQDVCACDTIYTSSANGESAHQEESETISLEDVGSYDEVTPQEGEKLSQEERFDTIQTPVEEAQEEEQPSEAETMAVEQNACVESQEQQIEPEPSSARRMAFSRADIQQELEENPETREKRLASMRLLGLITDESAQEEQVIEEKPQDEVEPEPEPEPEPSPARQSYSAVLKPQNELEVYLQEVETERHYAYKSLLHTLFNTNYAPKPEQDVDTKITMEECSTFSEFREEMRKKGYDVRQYVVQHTVQYYSRKYINVNSIKFATSCLTYLFAVALLLIGYFVCDRYAGLGYKPYLCTGIVMFAIPCFYGVRYLAYKDKHAPATFSFMLSFATAFMVALILSMAFLLFAFFYPKSNANISDVNTLIAPVFYPSAMLLLLPISVIIYALLYRTRKFYVI